MQSNFNRQMSQIRFRVSPGYKYTQLDGTNITRKRLLIALFIAIIIVAGALTAYNFGLKPEDDSPNVKYYHGAVAANGEECAEIGASILKRNGSVADAAIATLLCEGVTCPQSAGLGGGFLMTIYIKDRNLTECLDAREVAPIAATRDMFVDDKNKSSLVGGLSIAVPGELKGMWELHQKYGKLPWKELFKSTIDLCRHGHVVTEYLARILKLKEKEILEIPSLREVYINPKTTALWKAGDRVKRLALADTMETIAKEGADTVYAMGKVGRQLLNDIKGFGGILTEADFTEYKVKWLQPAKTTLKYGEHLYTMPLSGSGPILVLVMNILRDFDLKRDPLSYHRIIEAFKLSYGRRSEMADPDFVESVAALVKNMTSQDYANFVRKKIDDKRAHPDVNYYGAHFVAPDDHGTAHISVLAPNGDAISVTSTINYFLGSMRRSKTGIILNDEMDDFSIPGQKNVYGIPPSEANFIQPGKRPLSSMAPTIVINADGQVSMVVGSAGGSRITTAIAHALIERYFLKSNASLYDIFSSKRLHHQLLPNTLYYEENFDQNIVNGLMALNHTVEKVTNPIGFGALVGILNDNDAISAAFDVRRGGSSVVF